MTEERLTEKQELFCFYYAHTMNQRKAARLAGYQNEKHGWELMQNPKIQRRVEKLKEALMESCKIDKWDLMRTYAQMAFADIGDFVEFGQDDAGENYLKLKKETKINGQLIDEVSVSKSGTRFKLADRFRALEKLEQFLENKEKPTMIVTGVPRKGEEE